MDDLFTLSPLLFYAAWYWNEHNILECNHGRERAIICFSCESHCGDLYDMTQLIPIHAAYLPPPVEKFIELRRPVRLVCFIMLHTSEVKFCETRHSEFTCGSGVI